jgi:hypothetical protein
VSTSSNRSILIHASTSSYWSILIHASTSSDWSILIHASTSSYWSILIHASTSSYWCILMPYSWVVSFHTMSITIFCPVVNLHSLSTYRLSVESPIPRDTYVLKTLVPEDTMVRALFRLHRDSMPTLFPKLMTQTLRPLKNNVTSKCLLDLTGNDICNVLSSWTQYFQRGKAQKSKYLLLGIVVVGLIN